MTDDEWLTLVKKAMALPPAPAQWVNRAIALGRQPDPTATVKLGTLHRWLASIRFDSWASAPQAAGMRSLRSQDRQLLLACPGGEVDLRIAAQAQGHFEMQGQVLLEAAAGTATLQALGVQGETSGPTYSSSLDEACEFRLSDIRPGNYQLTVHLQQGDIVLPALQIGATGPSANP